MALSFERNTVLFVCASMIHTPKTMLRYDRARTALTTEQRFQQTLKGIASLRAYMATTYYDYRIILLEASPLPHSYLEQLRSQVDLLVDYSQNERVKACTTSDNKSLGEVGTLEFLRTLPSKPFSHIVKFGIRYSVNDQFDITSYLTNRITIVQKNKCFIHNPLCATHVQTAVYAIPFRLFPLFLQQLERCYEWLESGLFYDIENCLVHTIETDCLIYDARQVGLTAVGNFSLRALPI